MEERVEERVEVSSQQAAELTLTHSGWRINNTPPAVAPWRPRCPKTNPPASPAASRCHRAEGKVSLFLHYHKHRNKYSPEIETSILAVSGKDERSIESERARRAQMTQSRRPLEACVTDAVNEHVMRRFRP